MFYQQTKAAIHSIKRRLTRICTVCSSGSPWEALRKGLEDMLRMPHKERLKSPREGKGVKIKRFKAATK